MWYSCVTQCGVAASYIVVHQIGHYKSTSNKARKQHLPLSFFIEEIIEKQALIYL